MGSETIIGAGQVKASLKKRRFFKLRADLQETGDQPFPFLHLHSLTGIIDMDENESAQLLSGNKGKR